MEDSGLNPLFGGSAFRTRPAPVRPRWPSLNPLFGGSAFRTWYAAPQGARVVS